MGPIVINYGTTTDRTIDPTPEKGNRFRKFASRSGSPNRRTTQPLDGRTVNQSDNDVNFMGSADIGGQSFGLIG
jgi:hypothetical protein